MKDNNNKLNYNQWTCGEYENSVTGLYVLNNAVLQLTNKYSNIGESSLKIIRKHETSTTAYIVRLSNLIGTNNIHASLDIYSPNNTTYINLFNGGQLVSTSCPASSIPCTVTLDATINSDYVDMRIFFTNPNDYCYIDNVKLSY